MGQNRGSVSATVGGRAVTVTNQRTAQARLIRLMNNYNGRLGANGQIPDAEMRRLARRAGYRRGV